MYKSLVLVLALVFGSLLYAQNISVNSNPPTEVKGQMVLPFAPNSMTITESNDPAGILAGNSVSCNGGAPNYYHSDNSYYRAFKMSDFGITEDFMVSAVEIGVEQATGNTGSQPVECILYTTNSTFPAGFPGSLTQIGTVSANVPDQNLTLFSFNVSGLVPAGTNQLVVEIHTPDGGTTLNTFFIGSNDAGETAPSYLKAADCSITSPVTTGSIGFGTMNIVMSVTGTENVPVELTSFNAYDVRGQVNIEWSTATETNNRGFEIQKSSDDQNFITVGFVKGQGTTTQAHSYSFVDKNANNGTFSYRLKQLDFNGVTVYSDVVTLNVDAPASYQLSQNFPNPFNPSTQISFALPVDAGVKISVFNALGQEMQKLTDNTFTAGTHTINFNASKLSSGLYFYTLEAKGIDGSSYLMSKKMMLMK